MPICIRLGPITEFMEMISSKFLVIRSAFQSTSEIQKKKKKIKAKEICCIQLIEQFKIYFQKRWFELEFLSINKLTIWQLQYMNCPSLMTQF